MTPVDAKSRGKRLKALRRGIEATQDHVAALSGVQRPMISKAENGDIEWRSGPVVKALARGFGLSVEEFESYLDSDPAWPLEKAMARARPQIEGIVARTRSAGREREVAELALRLAHLDVSEDVLELTSLALQRTLRRSGERPTSALAEMAREYAHEISNMLERGSRSHKSGGPPRGKGR